MGGGDDVPDPLKGFVQVADNLVFLDDNDGKGMAPKHTCHPVPCGIQINQPAILSQGMGPCEEAITRGPFPPDLVILSLGKPLVLPVRLEKV